VAKPVWRVKLVAELRPGVTTETEVACIERDGQTGLADLGLRLTETRQLTAAFQGMGSALSSIGFGTMIAFSSLLSAERSWHPVWLLFSAFAISLVTTRLFLAHLPDRLGGCQGGADFGVH
jgi:hypothetical protein